MSVLAGRPRLDVNTAGAMSATTDVGREVRIGRDASRAHPLAKRETSVCSRGAQEARRGGQSTSHARRGIGHDPSAQAGRPPAHGAQADDVDRCGKRDDRNREGPDVDAVAEGDRTAWRAIRGELEADEERGGTEDERRPGEVREERAAQRMAGVPAPARLSRAASSASRRVMRRYSKYR